MHGNGLAVPRRTYGQVGCRHQQQGGAGPAYLPGGHTPARRQARLPQPGHGSGQHEVPNPVGQHPQPHDLADGARVHASAFVQAVTHAHPTHQRAQVQRERITGHRDAEGGGTWQSMAGATAANQVEAAVGQVAGERKRACHPQCAGRQRTQSVQHTRPVHRTGLPHQQPHHHQQEHRDRRARHPRPPRLAGDAA